VAALRGAVDSGRRLGLHMPGLRAATRLVRLRQPDAVEQLRRVYESFTEGFDDADLVDARAALAELDVPVARGQPSAAGSRSGPRVEGFVRDGQRQTSQAGACALRTVGWRK
jgi:hypothetical protein